MKSVFFGFLALGTIVLISFQNCSGFQSMSNSLASQSEDDSNYLLQASDGSYQLPLDRPLSLIDDPSIYLRSIEALEGADAIFQILLNKPSSEPVTVTIDLQDGSAIAGLHYVPFDGPQSIVFNPGETGKTVKVSTIAGGPVVQDRLVIGVQVMSSSVEIGQGLSGIEVVPVLKSLKVQKVASDGANTCSIDKDNKLFCWGDTLNGILGEQSSSVVIHPFPVAPNLSFSQVDILNGRACAITLDQDLYCWGINREAAPIVVNSTEEVIFSPTLIPAIGKVQKVEISSDHICGIQTGGDVFCWGRNQFGELGQDPGIMISSAEPVRIEGLTAPAANLGLGYGGSCAVLETGQVSCWGQNLYGRFQPENFMVQDTILAPTLLDAVSIAEVQMSEFSLCLRSEIGTLSCRGDSPSLFESFSLTGSTFVEVLGFNDIKKFYLGNNILCGLTNSSEFYCKGNTSFFQNSANSEALLTVDGLLPIGREQGTYTDFSMIWTNLCLISSEEELYCLGSNTTGQLGLNPAFANLVPRASEESHYIKIVDPPSFGAGISCGLKESGQLDCWGLLYKGDGTPSRLYEEPTEIIGASNVLDVAVVSGTFCWIEQGGGVKCLGRFNTGAENQLVERHSTPFIIENLNAKKIFSARSRFCAIDQQDNLQCWGDYFIDFQDPIFATAVPIAVNLSAGVESFAMNSSSSCAVLFNGEVYCWGFDLDKVTDTFSDGAYYEIPRKIYRLPDARDIAATEDSYCVVSKDEGNVYCFGSFEDGQLGVGFVEPTTDVSKAIGLAGVSKIYGGPNQYCAVLETSRVRCWGRNQFGQLGINSSGSVWLPRSPLGLRNIKDVSITKDEIYFHQEDGSMISSGGFAATYRQFPESSVKHPNF